jgi:hypothetical protein
MTQGELGLRPAEVLHGGVEGSVRHFAFGGGCGGVDEEEVSEVAKNDLESEAYHIRQGN